MIKENDIKKISIRARVAYGLKCLDVVIDERYSELASSVYLEKIIAMLWSFNTMDLDVSSLEKNMNEISPTSILQDDYEGNFEYLTNEDYTGFKSFYSKLDDDILRLIHYLIEMPFCSLFEDLGKYGKSSFDYLISFLDVCYKLNVKVPPFGNIKNSLFKENMGWGDIRNKEYWLNEKN